MCRHKAGWAESWQWPKFQMFRTSFWISNWNVGNAPVYEHDYCRPKFRFPSTRISFAVHTLYRYVIIPNNNILCSHPKKSWKWVANVNQCCWRSNKEEESGKTGLMMYKKLWNWGGVVFGKFVSTVWLPAKEEKEEQWGNGLQNGGYNLRTGLSNFTDNN